jgi:hypothetical protein
MLIRVALLLPPELKDEIQELANVETEGGLNRQIRKLLTEALTLRQVPQRVVLGQDQAFYAGHDYAMPQRFVAGGSPAEQVAPYTTRQDDMARQYGETRQQAAWPQP